MRLISVSATALLLICTSARAEQSCQQLAGIAGNAPAAEAALFVVVDQTTVLDDRLKAQVLSEATNFVTYGREAHVARFSAFVQNHYAEWMLEAALDQDLSKDQRYNLPKRSISNFDNCRLAKLATMRRGLAESIKGSLGSASNEIIKSEILSSLRDLSKTVRESHAQRKVVLLASDMLENSAATTFYSRNAPRKIDAKAELDKVAKANIVADFGGAEIYVLGAAVAPSESAAAASTYRDADTMTALKSFWQAWFEKSNAKVVEFGAPALLSHLR